MIIGASTLHLYLPGVFSLKDKRSLVKPLLKQLRRRFEVAAAEVGNHDTWQTADIAIVVVSNDTNHVYAVLDKTIRWIEEEYRAVELLEWDTELR